MENDTHYLFALKERFSGVILGNSIFFIIAGFIGILGNSTVVVFYFFRIKEKKGRYFIPLQAIVDISACLILPTAFVMNDMYRFAYPSDAVCRILSFLAVWAVGASVHILPLIAIERYFMVCKPLAQKMSSYRKRVIFILACGVALVTSLPLFGIAGVSTKTISFVHNVTLKYQMCETFSLLWYKWVFLLFLMLSIMITAILYIPILKKIRKQSLLKRQTEKVTQTQKGKDFTQKVTASRREMVQRRLSIMFFIIFLAYFPSMITTVLYFSVIRNSNSLTDADVFAFILFDRLYFLNHVVNPFVYCYFDSKFKDQLRKSFQVRK